MDLQDIRTNNFGSVSQEGSGTALKSILKEEFYRTMTLIEGRVPLWWIVPPDRGAQGYEQMRGLLQVGSESSPSGSSTWGTWRGYRAGAPRSGAVADAQGPGRPPEVGAQDGCWWPATWRHRHRTCCCATC
jgi:hypothetical protein